MIMNEISINNDTSNKDYQVHENNIDGLNKPIQKPNTDSDWLDLTLLFIATFGFTYLRTLYTLGVIFEL